ncbi:alanine racemase [Melaminivora sp.]
MEMLISAPQQGPRLIVDGLALQANWRTVAAACPAGSVGAVLKHDAYGLGLGLVAPALWHLGCRDFWVASLEEALALRQALGPAALQTPLPQPLRIGVLNGLCGHAVADFAAHGLMPALTGLHEVAAVAAWQGAPLPLAVHLDTGLTRVGLGAAELDGLAPGSALWQHARPELWLTHLGRFHDPEAEQCLEQRRRFEAWTARLPAARRSIATSSSVFAGSAWHFDHVRVGSALWGVPTSVRATAALQPVACLQAPVLRVAEVPAGTEIGYAGGYTTERACRIATIGMGYGDGLPFGLINRGHMVLAGRRAPIVGGVAMGMVGLDVSAYAPDEIRPGMWAEVYGAQQPLAELAAAAGLPPNVLLTLSARLAVQRQLTPPPLPASPPEPRP